MGVLQLNNFYLEIPNNKRKEEIIDYINELELYNSEINGIELLAKILDGYSFEETLENCLKRSNKEYAIKNGKNQVNTYLLIRKSDNKIVGAIIMNHECDEAYHTVSWGIDAPDDQVVILFLV